MVNGALPGLESRSAELVGGFDFVSREASFGLRSKEPEAEGVEVLELALGALLLIGAASALSLAVLGDVIGVEFLGMGNQDMR